MLKRILIIIGILLVGIISFSLLNKPLEDNTAVANKEDLKPLFTKEETLNQSTLNLVTEKIHETYADLKFVVSYNSEKELKIQVQENEEYFNSIKKDIESIAKNEIKSSILKDYTVIVMRLDLSSYLTEEQQKINDELLLITKPLNEALKADYDVYKNITTSSEKSITIYTSIKGTGKNAQKLAMEIEDSIKKILQTKEFDSVPQIDSYEIKILNAKGKVVN